jgi:thioredoxin reductase/ferredoxin
MTALLARYVHWLHLSWPAGRVEPLPVVGADGATRVPGLYVCGDLAGVPLLKFALDSGVRAVRAIATELGMRGARGEGGAGADGGAAVASATAPAGASTGAPAATPAVALAAASSGSSSTASTVTCAAATGGDAGRMPDLVILGAGVSGLAAAVEARRLGLSHVVIEAAEPLATLVAFPRGKPIFTYPGDWTPEGALQVSATIKEALVEELRAQVARAGVAVTPGRAESVTRARDGFEVRLAGGAAVRARRVLIAIGRSGDHRRLGVPGEGLDKVSNRLHDPGEYRARDVLVVGGGDSAAEAAVALSDAGARVTLVHRGAELARPKPENAAAVRARADAGALALRPGTRVRAIHAREVEIEGPAGIARIANDDVFVMVGREAPLAFLRRSGVAIAGEHTRAGTVALALFLAALGLMYDWKGNGFLEAGLWSRLAWPADVPQRLAGLGAWWAAQVDDRTTLVGALAVSMKSRSFYYTLLYTALVAGHGWARVRRRRTPYVTAQTTALVLVQAVPLFLLPEVVLPWLGYRGAFDRGWGAAFGDALFERYIPAAEYAARQWPEWGHPRAYWRAYGLILAWPLNVYNVFTAQPLWAWIGIGFVQTFVLIPLVIRRWGKGAYCGWVCSCGALAETVGDTLRTRMPHGPGWNRVNLVGQVFLAAAFALLGLRIAAWVWPDAGLGAWFTLLFEGKDAGGRLASPLAYKWVVDVLAGGVLGVGLYLRYSGRVWCRFACPLAALMHVYARFSRFAIVAEKAKCISCNVCTSVCHQGIDVMAFANRGRPMQDPQCVRCSACVHACPTGVLRFGEVAGDGRLIRLDDLLASPVQAREGTGGTAAAAASRRD